MTNKAIIITTFFGMPWFYAGCNNAWSAPQSQIYFLSYSGNFREQGIIYRMNPDGTRQTKVTALNGTDPAFSPDGRKVMFQSNHGLLGKGEMFAWHENIWIKSLVGTKVSQVADYDSYGPAFSPDGELIAYMSGYRDPHGPDHDFDIVVKKIGGSKPKSLTQNRGTNDTYPSFSPDSKKILFSSGPTPSGLSEAYGNLNEENRDIYIIGVDGSGLRRLTNDTPKDNAPLFKDDSNPVMSSDGKKIAFVRGRYSDNGRRYYSSHIFLMNADDTKQTRLTYKGTNNYSPSYSPNGKQIASVSNRDGNSEIYVMNADGTNQKRLTNSPAEEGFPRWVKKF